MLLARREQAIASFTDFAATSVLSEGGRAPDLGLLLATRVLTAGTADLITSWLAGSLEADRKAIIATLERLLAAV